MAQLKNTAGSWSLIRHVQSSYRLTGPNQAAAKTVRGQSLPTSAPSSPRARLGAGPQTLSTLRIRSASHYSPLFPRSKW